VEVWGRGNSSSGALVYGAARESFLVEEAGCGDAHHPDWYHSRPLGSLTWGLDCWCSFYGGHGCYYSRLVGDLGLAPKKSFFDLPAAVTIFPGPLELCSDPVAPKTWTFWLWWAG
jgi:hypothetical protein